MFVHRVKLRNVLSYGPEEQELDLGPLNVLIGPNGSGKSNLIEVMGLLKAVAADLSKAVRENGGIDQWIWSGSTGATCAEVEVVVEGPVEGRPIRYGLKLGRSGPGALRIEREWAEQADGEGLESSAFLKSTERQTVVRTKREGWGAQVLTVDQTQSTLSRFKHPAYRELVHLSEEFPRIALFRELPFGRKHAVRMPQKPDLPNSFLLEDAGNLGLVLNQFMREYEARDQLLERLRALYEGVTDYHVDIQYGTVQLFLREGDFPVPATRLSDGTLRYLCLIAILCHPTPPPLVCIEEPELGLHPDILSDIAELLREASERCQLIVTTHSDVIVDALTDTPESMVICEKHDGSTTLRRLDAGELGTWLEKYRLGELWSSGHLGGNRW